MTIKQNIRSKGLFRSGEVVVRSMVSSQLACILTAIVPQFVIILNSLIVSNMLGMDHFKAVSVFNPITGMILLLTGACCLGPSIQAGKAYGELDIRTADRLYTLSGIMCVAISAISALVIFVFKRGILERISTDPAIRDCLYSYINPVSLYLLLSGGACLLNAFVSASGSVRKVTTAVFVSGLVNVISIYVLVRFFCLGTEAVGIALCLSAATNILMLLPAVVGRRFPFKFITKGLDFATLVKKNIVVWISVSSNALSTAIIQFAINIIILHFLPSDGLFAWGICLIALNVVGYAALGFCDAFMYTDAFLTGEGDHTGRLKVARSYICELCAVMFLFASAFAIFPDKLAMLFGAGTYEKAGMVRIPLICTATYAVFNEIFCTFGIFSIQRRPMIKLGYDIVIAIAVPLLVFLSAILFGRDKLWLGFAVSPVILASYVAIISGICRRRDRNLIPFFLFDKVNDVISLDLSIFYTRNNMAAEMERIRKFLEICEIDATLSNKIELCCEELINNINNNLIVICSLD
mgnify:CR=1 FL=1